MKRSGAGVPAIADATLHALARAEGPFLSAYLTSEVAVEHPGEQAEARWAVRRRELARGAAPEPLLAEVDRAVPEAHESGLSLGVVAAADGTLVVDHDADPLPADVVGWSPVPVLTPLVRWRSAHPPHVVVLADRTGADVIGVRRDGPPERDSAGAGEWRVSKARAGGWAHWSMQHRVEEAWSRNARAAAVAVESMVARTGAELVLLAGEPKAVGRLRPLLHRVAARTVVRDVEGARPLKGPAGPVEDEVMRQVRSAAAEHTVAVLDAFHHHRGAGHRATEGVEPTLAALRAAQVDALLVHDERLAPAGHRADERTAWVDPGAPPMCATSPAALRDAGVADPVEGPLVDVAVRAALAAGAGVQLVPAHGGPAEGIGSLLRWSA